METPANGTAAVNEIRTVSTTGGPGTVHPVALFRLIKAEIRAVHAEKGAVTIRDVSLRLGQRGYPCPQASFDRAFRKVFPATVAAKATDYYPDDDEDEDDDNEPDDSHMDTMTRLSSFISFAGAVERCGGVERAKHYLDVLERLKGKL